MSQNVSEDITTISSDNSESIKDANVTLANIRPILEKETRIGGRRSFHNRRSLSHDVIALQNEAADKGNELNSGNHEGTRNTHRSNFEEECMKKFKCEKEAWQAIYEERKTTHKEIKAFSASQPIELDWNSTDDLLTNEDKQFLKDRPNYENIISKMKKVKEKYCIYMHMKQININKCDKLITVAEQERTAIKKKMFEHVRTYYK